MKQGERASGFYLLENGRATIQHEINGVVTRLGMLEQGVIIGGEEWYTKRPFTTTIITIEPSRGWYISEEAIKCLETEAPKVVMAIHRMMAANLGNKLYRANHLVEALQR